MNTKEKLTEIICNVVVNDKGNRIRDVFHPEFVEKIVNNILESSVMAPPMKLGQTCFKPDSYLNEVDECRVSSITQKADGTFKLRLTNLRGKWVFEITADAIGKTVFLTREEAEAALKGR